MSWTFVYLGVIICMNIQHCFLKDDDEANSNDDEANSNEQLRTTIVILGCVVAVVTTTVLWLCRKKLKCDCDEMSTCEKTEFSFDHNITDIVATDEKKSKTEEQKPKTENNSDYEGLTPETMVKDEAHYYVNLERERRNRNLQPETTDDNRSLDDYMKPVSSHDQNDTEMDELENIYDPVEIENMPNKADPESDPVSDNEEFYVNLKF